MTPIRIGNAPCSWGTLEFEGLSGETVPYDRMLNELRDTGYMGTELGDWGYLPTDPSALRAALEQRDLCMLGAFVPVALHRPAAVRDGLDQALRTARLLAAVAHPATPPFIVLADANGTVPVRTAQAGRVAPSTALGRDDMAAFAGGAHRIARAVREETGLRTVFHHHAAGYVETPVEIDRFLEATNPDLVGLVLDTGHYQFGGGDPVEALRSYRDRIWHVHFKDFDPRVAVRAREEAWDYFEQLRQGVFCELGQGTVPFETITDVLRDQSYDGWIVVEQDVLPGMGAPRESAARNRAYLHTLGL